MWFQLQLSRGVHLAIFMDAQGDLWWNYSDVYRLVNTRPGTTFHCLHLKRIEDLVPVEKQHHFDAITLKLQVVSDATFEKIMMHHDPQMHLHLTRLFQEGRVAMRHRIQNNFSSQTCVILEECQRGCLSMSRFVEGFKVNVMNFYYKQPVHYVEPLWKRRCWNPMEAWSFHSRRDVNARPQFQYMRMPDEGEGYQRHGSSG